MARTKADAQKSVVTTVNKDGEQVIIRKKRRFRPGTRATLEIRKYMNGKNATSKCIPKTRIEKLIREIVQENNIGPDRLSQGAISALWEGTVVLNALQYNITEYNVLMAVYVS